MGIPGWAIPLGVALKAPEIADDWMGLFRNIRDDKAKQANNEGARTAQENLAWAAQEQDPSVRLENFREVSRDASGMEQSNRQTRNVWESTPARMDAPTLGAFQKEVDAQSKGTIADVKAVEAQNQLAAFQKEAADAGTDIMSYGLQRPDRIPLSALQGVHNALSTFATGAQKEIERRDKETKETEKQANIAGFQSAIAGLTAPSKSPVDLRRFASNGGYAPISDVEGDIRQAAASYNVGDSDEVNKAVSEARGAYKDTYLPTETGKVGRTSYTGQRNLLGDFRKDAQSTAPVVNVKVQENRDRTAEFGLRKEFLGLPEVKEFPAIEANAKRAVTALNATGSKLAVDQALITVFNKMIDPSSVVRESEYARTPQDMAVLARIKGKWGKIQEGGAGLPPEERIALARMITNFTGIASKQYNARAGEYRQLAKEYGFDPGRVVARRNAIDDDARPVAPAGTKAKVNGKIVTSDGKGGWK